MSNTKSAIARSAKRNARAKSKKTSSAKAKVAPKALKDKSFRKKFGSAFGNADFDQILSRAVKDINKGTNELETSIKNPTDMVVGLKKNIGELFKLYAYVTLIDKLHKESIISSGITMDLRNISLSLIDIDRRVIQMGKLLESNEEEAVVTEALEIGTLLQQYSEELHTEVMAAEPNALDIEESLDKLANEFDPNGEINLVRKTVLQNNAYQYLDAFYKELNPATEQTQPETEVA